LFLRAFFFLLSLSSLLRLSPFGTARAGKEKRKRRGGRKAEEQEERERRERERERERERRGRRETLFFVHPQKMFYTCPSPKPTPGDTKGREGMGRRESKKQGHNRKKVREP
jgi:hypothetical protein